MPHKLHRGQRFRHEFRWGIDCGSAKCCLVCYSFGKIYHRGVAYSANRSGVALQIHDSGQAHRTDTWNIVARNNTLNGEVITNRDLPMKSPCVRGTYDDQFCSWEHPIERKRTFLENETPEKDLTAIPLRVVEGRVADQNSPGVP